MKNTLTLLWLVRDAEEAASITGSTDASIERSDNSDIPATVGELKSQKSIFLFTNATMIPLWHHQNAPLKSRNLTCSTVLLKYIF